MTTEKRGDEERIIKERAKEARLQREEGGRGSKT